MEQNLRPAPPARHRGGLHIREHVWIELISGAWGVSDGLLIASATGSTKTKAYRFPSQLAGSRSGQPQDRARHVSLVGEAAIVGDLRQA
jgi:hypothetical protein